MDYANHLMEYLQKNQVVFLHIRVFSTLENLLSYLNNHTTQLLLVSEDVPVELLSSHNVENILFLSESGKASTKESYPCIYKFQSAKGVLESILKVYQNTNTFYEPINENGNLHITTVISLGDCAVNDKMEELRQMHKKDGSVLVFEFYIFSMVQSDSNLSNLLYYLKDHNYLMESNITQFVDKMDGADTIHGVTHFSDLKELAGEDCMKIKEFILRQSTYENIILGFDYFDKYVLELLEISKEIILLSSSHMASYDKVNAFHHMLTMAGKDEIWEKIKVER